VDRPAGVRLAFRGELAAAREVFQRLLAAAEQRGEARSGAVFLVQLCEAGRAEAAAEVVGRLAGQAAAQDHPWGLATADRSAAVVALAGGYDDAAATRLAAAAAAYQALGLGFDAARALLVLGRAQRRAKKRAAARQSLEQARAGFEQLGCKGWARAAAAEADRVSGRRAAPGGGLTPGERRVAELAAAGLSNKQVAARLYLSDRTVEAHLSRAYAKLGVTSRAQLTRALRPPA